MMFTSGRQPVPLFVEPCAGAIGVALALAGSRAPCGWMGGKSGYADAILQTMGLRRGQGLEEFWIADTNDWAKAWPVLLGGHARECAEIIRGWCGTPAEEARRWRDLRDVWRVDGTPRCRKGRAVGGAGSHVDHDCRPDNSAASVALMVCSRRSNG